MTTHTATLTIAAPAARVFAALTEPELVARWQYGRRLDTSWRPGAPILFHTDWHDGHRLPQAGTVLEYRPGELLRYSLHTPRPGEADAPENRCVTTYSLHPQGESTEVELTQQDPHSHAFIPPLVNILAGLEAVVLEEAARAA